MLFRSPCSRLGEQEEKNRKHRPHICECGCAATSVSWRLGRQRQETTGEGGSMIDERCFVFTQKEDQSNGDCSGRIYIEEQGDYQVTVRAIYRATCM